MKKLIVLILAISSYVGAFEGKPGQIIDGKCENASIAFKLCSEKDGNIGIFTRVKFTTHATSGTLDYRISFLDKDGFCWHKEMFFNVTDPSGNEHLWNDMIMIPDYAWVQGVSTKIEVVRS